MIRSARCKENIQLCNISYNLDDLEADFERGTQLSCVLFSAFIFLFCFLPSFCIDIVWDGRDKYYKIDSGVNH